jgi:hypothetical protein
MTVDVGLEERPISVSVGESGFRISRFEGTVERQQNGPVIRGREVPKGSNGMFREGITENSNVKNVRS